MSSTATPVSAPSTRTSPFSAPPQELEGIEAAKTRGVYKGRKPSIDASEVRRLHEQEKPGPAAIAKRLGIGRASVYSVLGKAARPA